MRLNVGDRVKLNTHALGRKYPDHKCWLSLSPRKISVITGKFYDGRCALRGRVIEPPIRGVMEVILNDGHVYLTFNGLWEPAND